MKLTDAGFYDMINIFTGKPTKFASTGVANNKDRFINIPAYQRPYRWKDENIDRLFSDYNENPSEYFLGSAVFVERQNGREFDVIDGQQRVTTLFLINYLRFVLKKYSIQRMFESNKARCLDSSHCEKLKNYYYNMVGKKSEIFDEIISKISEVSYEDPNGLWESIDELELFYKEKLCIASNGATEEITKLNQYEANKKFLKNDKLCLKYSRSHYDAVLKESLYCVYLSIIPDTNNLELKTTNGKPLDEQNTYIKALHRIFYNVWDKNSDASLDQKIEDSIQRLDSIIKDMTLCVVLTNDEQDAYKLFEVLNDRSLKIDDLELIKNHFFKEYCTKSDDVDDDETIDNNIIALEELWSDTIFSGNTETNTRLISYFSAVYFTGNADLSDKDNAEYKDKIDEYYSKKKYPKGEKKYTFEKIKEDFNIYYAVKLILEKFQIPATKYYIASLDAEQSSFSITYKAMQLLNALKRHGVMSGLINLIISYYVIGLNNSLHAEDFEKSFSDYLSDLMNSSKEKDEKYIEIHKCSYDLWRASIMSADYEISRRLSKTIIENNHRDSYSFSNICLSTNDFFQCESQFNQWLNNWNYFGPQDKNFILKVLMLNLLLSDLKEENGKKVITFGDLTYHRNAGDLQLDHLEAKVINQANRLAYYSITDNDKRNKFVNGSIGNFMILDSKDNNQKKNYPLYEAIKFYDRIKTNWVVKEIYDMLSDKKYFDLKNKIPLDSFFTTRSERLKSYFKSMLKKGFGVKEVEL